MGSIDKNELDEVDHYIANELELDLGRLVGSDGMEHLKNHGVITKMQICFRQWREKRNYSTDLLRVIELKKRQKNISEIGDGLRIRCRGFLGGIRTFLISTIIFLKRAANFVWFKPRATAVRIPSKPKFARTPKDILEAFRRTHSYGRTTEKILQSVAVVFTIILILGLSLLVTVWL